MSDHAIDSRGQRRQVLLDDQPYGREVNVHSCGLSASRAELALTAIKQSMHQTAASRMSVCDPK